MLCESSENYLVSFIIYCGSDIKRTLPVDIDLLKDFDEYTNPSKVVLSSISSLLNQGHCIIVDNLYISPVSGRALSGNSTDI